MRMATLMATMPDLWQRVLNEHAADAEGRCQTCRRPDGLGVVFPCLSWQVARESQNIYESEIPAAPPNTVPFQRRPNRAEA